MKQKFLPEDRNQKLIGTIKHRKLTLEKKILPPLPQGFEPATFQSRVRRSNH